MKHIREYIQTILVVCLGICHLTLILRFSLDLAGSSLAEGGLSFVYSISNVLIAPFEGTFDSQVAKDSIFNNCVLCTIVVYSFIWFCLFRITQIVFKIERKRKIIAAINLFFIGAFFVHLARATLDYFNASESSFFDIIKVLTSIVTNITKALLPSDYEHEIILRSIISLLFVALVWYTTFKLSNAILDKIPERQEGIVIRKPEPKKEELVQEEIQTQKIKEVSKDSKPTQGIKNFATKLLTNVKEFFKNLFPKEDKEEPAFKPKDKSKDTTKSPLQQ